MENNNKIQKKKSKSPEKNFSKDHVVYLKKEKNKKNAVKLMQIGLLFFMLFIWELFAQLDIIDTFIMSSPFRISKTIWELLIKGEIFYHMGITLYETILSFIISTGLGVIFAVILWYFVALRKVLDPYIVVINSLPKIALGPIIIIWFGVGLKAIIVMAVLISIVITIISMLSAFLQCDKGKILLLESMGASKLQILTKLVLPSSLPAFVSVLKINVGMAWVGAIMGEYLVSRAGLGFLITYGGQVFKMDLIMASIVILCGLAAIMYYLVALTEKILIRWK